MWGPLGKILSTLSHHGFSHYFGLVTLINLLLLLLTRSVCIVVGHVSCLIVLGLELTLVTWELRLDSSCVGGFGGHPATTLFIKLINTFDAH